MNNLLIKAMLGRLTHGDTGSTILGLASSALLASNVNFGDLGSKDPSKKSMAFGSIIGIIIITLWGYFIGKKTPDQIKQEVQESQKDS